MSATTTIPNPAAYPVKLNIDYPDRNLNRLTSFFRIFVALPIWIILAALIGASFNWKGGPSVGGFQFQYMTAGLLFLPVLLMLLFRQKYPRWWFDWNYQLIKFSTRVGAFILLLRDEYPSTDEEQAIHIDIPYPEAKQLGRGMPLVKWFLAIPHYVVLACLGIAVVVCVVIAWFAILFTGRYPKGLFNFIVGVLRWELRVCAYAFLLVTDKYPPFSLSAEA